MVDLPQCVNLYAAYTNVSSMLGNANKVLCQNTADFVRKN